MLIPFNTVKPVSCYFERRWVSTEQSYYQNDITKWKFLAWQPDVPIDYKRENGCCQIIFNVLCDAMKRNYTVWDPDELISCERGDGRYQVTPIDLRGNYSASNPNNRIDCKYLSNRSSMNRMWNKVNFWNRAGLNSEFSFSQIGCLKNPFCFNILPIAGSTLEEQMDYYEQ